MTEAHIQSLLKDHEQRLRRYFEQVKSGPQTFSGVERAYEEVFQDGGVDVVGKGLQLLNAGKKKSVPLAERDLNFARIVKELSLD
jgi:hypothetical protein